MLSFRMILTVIAAGLCLWGLFSLLDNLNEPGLLRSEDRAVVKGCDSLDSEETLQACPPLLCQKALFDAKSFPARSILKVTVDLTNGPQRLIAVSADDSANTPAANEFICVMRREKVLLSRAATPAEIEGAVAMQGGWLEELSDTMAP